MLRCRYASRSNSTGRSLWSSFSLEGMTGLIPKASTYSSIQLARYPLSPPSVPLELFNAADNLRKMSNSRKISFQTEPSVIGPDNDGVALPRRHSFSRYHRTSPKLCRTNTFRLLWTIIHMSSWRRQAPAARIPEIVAAWLDCLTSSPPGLAPVERCLSTRTRANQRLHSPAGRTSGQQGKGGNGGSPFVSGFQTGRPLGPAQAVAQNPASLLVSVRKCTYPGWHMQAIGRKNFGNTFPSTRSGQAKRLTPKWRVYVERALAFHLPQIPIGINSLG